MLAAAAATAAMSAGGCDLIVLMCGASWQVVHLGVCQGCELDRMNNGTKDEGTRRGRDGDKYVYARDKGRQDNGRLGR